jgi:hypothetical protein
LSLRGERGGSETLERATWRGRQLFNHVRPHQALAGRRHDVHLEARTTRRTIKPTEPETLPLS